MRTLSSCRAQLSGRRQAHEGFLDQRYSRRHTRAFDGGAVGAASSSPQVVPLPVSDAAAVDPEEMFVASLASCHMLWYLSIAAQQGFTLDRYGDEAAGEMARNERQPWVMAPVVLRPCVEFDGLQPSRAQIVTLHDGAHRQCFIANAVKTQVLCDPRYPVVP